MTMNNELPSNVIPIGELKCVWMQAGVINYRLCHNNYDCSSCAFDQALRGKGNGRILGNINLSDSTQNFYKLISQELVDGFELAEYYFYHPCHMWVRVEQNGEIRIGFDDFAQRLIGALIDISMPSQESFDSGNSKFSVSGKNISLNVNIPFSGRLIATNALLKNSPELVNFDPYRRGWLILMEPDSLKDTFTHLNYGSPVHSWFRKEIKDFQEEIVSLLANCDQNELEGVEGASAISLLSSVEPNLYYETIRAYLTF